MPVRLRLGLTQAHQKQLAALADHYGVKPSELATIMLTQAIDEWARSGPGWAKKATKGPEVVQSGPEVAQSGPQAPAPPPYGRPPGPKVARSGPEVAQSGPCLAQSGPGMDLALKILERERERESNSHSDPEDVAAVTEKLANILNSVAGTTHNPHDQASQRAVYCRLRGEGCEPATVAQMITVVENKAKAWRGTKYAAGLNLLTLLGDRFGQYLGTSQVDTSSQTADGGAFGYLGGE